MTNKKDVYDHKICPRFTGVTALLLALMALLAILLSDTQPATATTPATGTETYTTYLPIIMNNSSSDGQFDYLALSDANVVPNGPALDALLAAQKPQLCYQPPIATNPLSYEQARRDAWAYLQQHVGAANLNTFRGLPEVATAASAQTFAMAAAVDNRPDGALAGLLIAYEKAPDQPMILVNTAGVFNLLGMPNHALAFLNEAESAAGKLSDTMNIPGVQVATNNRAHAHISLGQWAAAETLLRPLMSTHTELSEARQNLAVALLCQNKDEEAAHYYRLGARRQWVDEDEEINGRLPLDQIYDTSAGETPTLPPMVIPAGTSGLADTASHYQGVTIDLIEDGNEIVTEQEILIEQIEARRADEPALTTIRFVNVVSAITSADQEPEMLALEADFAAAGDNLAEMLDRHGDEFVELGEQEFEPVVYFAACRSLLTNQWGQQQGALQAYAAARRTHAYALYEVQTGLAANLIDPLKHQYASLLAEADANDAQTDIVNTTATVTGGMAALWDFCEGFRADAFPPPAAPTLPSSLECPPFVRGVKGSIKLSDFVTFSVTCEKVELEVGTSGALGYFSQLTYHTRQDSLTLFAGAKQKISAYGLVELSAKEGLYIKATPRGQITDFGLKVSSAGAISNGVIAGKVDGPGFEFSMVSGAIN
ncbi:MAG: tetratricopeptide repeat protein [Anaerolineae bacterium]|nr:tetratricopeptide repeat protein [Anaerolineae bacterium]